MESFESEEKALFLQFIQNLPALAWVKDPDGRYVFVNEAAARAFGRTESEIMGQTDQDLFDGATAARFRRNDELTLEKGSPLQTFEILPESNGVARYSLVTKFLIRAANGSVYVAGTATDVTDRRTVPAHEEFLLGISEKIRVEEVLLDREEKYRALFESINQGFGIAEVIVDESGRPVDYRMIEINPQFEKLTGQSREKFLDGRTVRQVAPELEEEWFEFYGSVGLTGVPAHREVQSEAWGRWFEASAYRIGEDHQRLIAILFTDITERKRSEASLRRSEQLYREIADQAPVMIWLTDARGKGTYLSQSWYEFTGQTPENGLGLGFLTAIDGFDGKDGAIEFVRAIESKSPLYSEHRLRRANGTYAWVISSAHPRLDDGGEFLGYIGSTLDITDRKLAEESLRASRDLNQSVIDSMPAHIAVLDTRGEITLVNKAWLRFAEENGSRAPLQDTGPGVNYLTVCRNAAATEPDAAAIGSGVSEVLSGKTESFSLEYPCDSPNAERWFLVTVFPLIGGGAVVSHQDITDRRHAEGEIGNAVERFGLAQKAGNVGIWDWNAETGSTYWSDQMWGFYGIEPKDENPTANFWEARLHESDRARVLEEISALLAGSEVEYRNEFRIVTKDGEVRWIGSSATVERTESGRPLRMYGVNLDITDRKLIEERIRSSEAQLKLVTDSIPALLSYIDRDSRYVFVNRRYTDWFGKSADEIVGRHMTEVLGKPAVDALQPHIEKVLDGERVNFEMWIDYLGGTRKFVSISYVPDLRAEGEIPGFYALVSDSTAQRRSEELLQFSEERMKIVTESLTDYAILSLDRDGVIESWNSGAENIFGYTDDEIVGQSAEIIFTPEDVKNGVPEKEMKNARTFGRASDERWHVRKDGSRFFASGVMVPLIVGGELSGYAKIATDLTEKRRQTEELQTAYEEMENRVLQRTQELSDLNASLLEQIRRRESDERQRIRLLQRIVTSQEDERRRIARDIHDQLGQRLTALRLKLASLSDLSYRFPEIHDRTIRLQQIAELLDSEVGFLAWQLRPAALDELGMTAALEAFVLEWSRHYSKRADFHAAGIQELRLVPEVETQVYRITQEALNNVIKHADAENVSVILERVESDLVLIIEDDGHGFDQEPKERRVGDKHGKGLAGMQERAELIGGMVEVESEPGSGTTIYLRVPLDARSLEAGENE
jgi:PAS domain S-box-containing protein